MKVNFGRVSILALFFPAPAVATEPPEFTAAGIVRGDASATMLVAGAGVSIYGHNLAGPCLGTPPRQAPQICGTSVLVDGKAAQLLFVSEKQINLILPADLPESANTEVRVVVEGTSSAPVSMPSGFEKTVVRLDEPAYVNMPVWLKVELPFEWRGAVRYPSVMDPAGFGCNQVEVRRDGKPLPIRPDAEWDRYGMAFSGNICGSYGPVVGSRAGSARLPLHLLYRFDTPGTYEVRFTLRDMPMRARSGKVKAESEWTPIEILPARPGQREQWLRDFTARVPGDPASLLSDFLPSLLGMPDDFTFETVAAYLFHPEPAVRRFAAKGLSYWPEDVASARLLKMIQSNGPSDVAVVFLIRQPAFREAHAGEIVDMCLPYLKSDSVVAMEGAVAAVRDGSSDAAVQAALRESADHITARANAQTGADLAAMLAESHDPRAHEILRRLVEQKYRQSANALASFRDPADMPALAGLFIASDENGAFLPELLFQKYGTAAVPYLEQELKDSPPRFTRRNVISQLMAAGDPVGFSAAAQALEERGAAHIDMVQMLKSQFPELRDAGDETMLVFLRARASVK